MEQVISIDEFGRVSGLVHRNQYDLTKLDAKSIKVERASDIRYASGKKKWYILYLTPPYKHCIARTCDLYDDNTIETLFFDDYDDAVKMEILLFNKFRMEGLI